MYMYADVKLIKPDGNEWTCCHVHIGVKGHKQQQQQQKVAYFNWTKEDPPMIKGLSDYTSFVFYSHPMSRKTQVRGNTWKKFSESLLS